MRILFFAMLFLTSCSRKPDKPDIRIVVGSVNGEACIGSSLLDPTADNREYLCLDGAHPRVVNGYSNERVFELLLAREKNAEDQLLNITDRGELYVKDLLKASRVRDEYGKSPRIQDVRKVRVTRTSDGKRTWVISMTANDGQTESLWVSGFTTDEDLDVRAISPY